MRCLIILITFFLCSCSQQISHEAIQDGYSACGNYNGVKMMDVGMGDVDVYCEDGHVYTIPKRQRLIKR
jgi:hypothetical protein